MTLPDRHTLRAALIALAEADPRVVALVSYGSEARGCADRWSDIDVVVFIRDADHAGFVAGWRAWVERLPMVLHVCEAGPAPRVICRGSPAPVRIDLAWWSEARLDEIATWTQPRPAVLTDMVLLDRSPGGRCSQLVNASPGQPPVDVGRAFALVADDLWYYLIRIHGILERGDDLAARTEFHGYVMENLGRLARLDHGALDHWDRAVASRGLAGALPPTDLADLRACLPDATDLRPALRAANRLGTVLCRRLAGRHGWAWPEALAAEMERLL